FARIGISPFRFPGSRRDLLHPRLKTRGPERRSASQTFGVRLAAAGASRRSSTGTVASTLRRFLARGRTSGDENPFSPAALRLPGRIRNPPWERIEADARAG